MDVKVSGGPEPRPVFRVRPLVDLRADGRALAHPDHPGGVLAARVDVDGGPPPGEDLAGRHVNEVALYLLRIRVVSLRAGFTPVRGVDGVGVEGFDGAGRRDAGDAYPVILATDAHALSPVKRQGPHGGPDRSGRVDNDVSVAITGIDEACDGGGAAPLGDVDHRAFCQIDRDAAVLGLVPPGNAAYAGGPRDLADDARGTHLKENVAAAADLVVVRVLHGRHEGTGGVGLVSGVAAMHSVVNVQDAVVPHRDVAPRAGFRFDVDGAEGSEDVSEGWVIPARPGRPPEVDHCTLLNDHALGAASPQGDGPVNRQYPHVHAAAGGEHDAARNREPDVVVRVVVREGRVPVLGVRVVGRAGPLVVVEVPVVGRPLGSRGVRAGDRGGVAPVRVRLGAHRLCWRADALRPRARRCEKQRGEQGQAPEPNT